MPHLGKVDGCVARLITRCRVVLLVRVVVFLVDDDQSEVGKGEEKGTAGTEQHLIAAFAMGLGTTPNLDTLTCTEARMIHPYKVAEVAAQAIDEVCCEGYLRKEKQGLFALTYYIVNKFNIYLCFT